MSKKTLCWSLALVAILLLIKNCIGAVSETPEHWSRMKSRTVGWFHSAANNYQHSRVKVHAIHQLAQKYPVFNTMILPWGDNADKLATASSASNNPTLQSLIGSDHYQPNYAFSASSQYLAQIETFSSGIVTSESGSLFICPSDMPYATGYQLTNPLPVAMQDGAVLESPTIAARGYINDCMMQKKYDLLYGADQHADISGTNTKNLTAFIPANSPAGCNSGISAKQPVMLKISATTYESPILLSINNKSQVVGYTQQTIVAPIDCNKACNTMLDYYCDADSTMNYCGEEVLDSYYISSIYKARNQRQYFCSCKIYNVAWNNTSWAFTNAVDVESAVKYNNPLKSITCSNVPPH